MPIASTHNISTTASLKAEIAKNKHILQRSSSRDSLRNLEQKLADPQILQKHYNIYKNRNPLHLFYYRFQLITGSYMLSSWESGIFNVFVLLAGYVFLTYIYKFFYYFYNEIVGYVA